MARRPLGRSPIQALGSLYHPDAPLLGRVRVWRRLRSGAWRLRRAYAKPVPFATARELRGDDLAEWLPVAGRGQPVICASSGGEADSWRARDGRALLPGLREPELARGEQRFPVGFRY